MTPPNPPGALKSAEADKGGRFFKGGTILLLGSGALKIGEAGEFDYSGSQAIKAFREEGIRVVLINPNIATNQTSWGLADCVYFLPVNPGFAKRIIEKERPDAISLSFGGQTALNCGVGLADDGVLDKYKVKVLGTPIESIRDTEDRERFNNKLKEAGIDTPKSHACRDTSVAVKAAQEIGYPVIIRGAFALGGKGSGRARNEKELIEQVKISFVESPQILVEEDLTGWKEIEYEVVRDIADNCITVCNMENIDPLGIHTGESIVIAPSQTLDNTDYQKLRSISIGVIRHLGIIGECNIQFAYDTRSRDYRVIEVNARLSRSSALASKATGYPLAFIAAKLALGYTLPELKNAITQVTCADFEPSLDYVALKIPRWDLQKFRLVSDQVTSEMKSVGEVMAIGRTFEEAIQKAVRMLNIGAEGLFPVPFKFNNLQEEAIKPTPRRIFAIAQALENMDAMEIHDKTGIDMWFLERIRNCALIAQELKKSRSAGYDLLKKAKENGFSDRAIASMLKTDPEKIREQRISAGMMPAVRQIDTLAGEFHAQTNYLYMTYHGTEHDVVFGESGIGNRESGVGSRESGVGNPCLSGRQAQSRIPNPESPIPNPQSPIPNLNKPKAIVIGGGPYSIGSSVEFDWCCVQTVHELQRQGFEVTMINSNPETVSTDYDECDQLFFEELSAERVRDIADIIKPKGIVVSMGGQIPNSLAQKLASAGLHIMGTNPENIDRAEDRNKFSSLLDELGVDQPEWKEFSDVPSARVFAGKVGYPVIVRPSYVLSGASMAVVHSDEELESYVSLSAFINKEAPIVVSKFEIGAKEIEFDGVSQNGEVLLYAISEHIENAGVHSGDATMVLPPQRINLETLRRIKRISRKIAKGLFISGPFNIQFLAQNNRLKVIECNLRASRSFPFASKVTGINFITLATKAILGIAPAGEKYQTIDLDHVGVKAAQFSFSRLKGADPRLGVEMASTGEVACFGKDAGEALLAALIAVGFKMPRKNILVTVGHLEDKVDIFPAVKQLHNKGYSLYATENTHAFLESRGLPSVLLHKVSEPRSPNIREYLEKKRIDFVINIPTHSSGNEQTDGYYIRRIATDHGIPLITNVQLAKRISEALEQTENADGLPLMKWPDLLEKE